MHRTVWNPGQVASVSCAELVSGFVKRCGPRDFPKLTISREKGQQTFRGIIFRWKANFAIPSFLGTAFAEEAALRAMGVVS
jgi:hypothetical protein